jgi:hypothetical protein
LPQSARNCQVRREWSERKGSIWHRSATRRTWRTRWTQGRKVWIIYKYLWDLPGKETNWSDHKKWDLWSDILLRLQVSMFSIWEYPTLNTLSRFYYCQHVFIIWACWWCN